MLSYVALDLYKHCLNEVNREDFTRGAGAFYHEVDCVNSLTASLQMHMLKKVWVHLY